MARPETRLVLLLIGGIALWANPALAQEGSLLTNLENETATAAQGWANSTPQKMGRAERAARAG